MEGWKLSKGEYQNENITEDQIWFYFNNLFSTKSVNRTSYKYCFMKSLLENVFNADKDGYLQFKDIFYKFTEIYWCLISKYALKQGDGGVKNKENKTSIELIFDKYLLSNPFLKEIYFENMDDLIKESLVAEITEKCKRYVVGAIYGDTDMTFYSFDLSKKILKFNPNILEFMKKYKYILLKLNHYEWVKYLEKVNKTQDTYSLLSKLDEASKRSNLSVYKKILYTNYKIHNCFYCGKPIYIEKSDNIEVDHFIPWTFIRDDKIWNLVLSCRNCNNSKRDKLPLDTYIETIFSQNDNIIKNKNILAKPNELILVENEFKIYYPNKLQQMYKSAKFNGFNDGWKPNGYNSLCEVAATLEDL